MSGLLRLGLLSAFVVGMALIVLAMNSFGQAMAQGNSNRCFWHLYSDTPQQVRILVTGTSRIRRSVVLEDLEQTLGYPSGSAANLAHAAVSPYFDYGLIDHITAQQDIDLILFEVWPQSPALRAQEFNLNPPSNYSGRLALGQKDRLYILGLPLRTQIRHILQDAANPLHASLGVAQLLRDRVAESIPLMFLHDRRKHTLSARTPVRNDGTFECFLEVWDKPGDRYQKGRPGQQALFAKFTQTFADPPLGAGWTDPDPLGYIQSDEMAEERAVLHKVVALAEARDAQLVFMYMPSIHVPVAHDQLATAFEAEFGAPLIYPDADMRAILIEDGFVDNNHLNTKGRAIYGPWFARTIADTLNELTAE